MFKLKSDKLQCFTVLKHYLGVTRRKEREMRRAEDPNTQRD